jgi:histidinol-phosphatase (PHP family)
MREAKRLQSKYQGHIELLVAFETEKLPPDCWQQTMEELRKQFAPDYIIGSVHDVNGICIDYSPEYLKRATEECGSIEKLQIKYFDAVAELVSTLRPEIVGHIDLIRKFDGPDASFSAEVHKAIDRALEAVHSVDGVLDVNPGAFRRGYSPVYPLPEILEKSKKMGIGVTLGDDGHGPHNVGEGLTDCLEAIRNAGYSEVHYLEHESNSTVWKSTPIGGVKPLGVVASGDST